MPSIAIIGGSGPEGRGLALRFAIGGYPVIIGSRDAARASETADGLLELKAGLPITGAANAEAAKQADWVLLSVPYEGLEATVKDLASVLKGKMVISVVAPLAMENGQFHAQRVPQGSAAELVQGLLPDSKVTSAFHNLSARELLKPEHVLDGDIVVCGDDADARQRTIELAGVVRSLRGVDGGPLSNSRYVEDLTALLLNLNRMHKARSTVKFVGL
ncbi:MAG: NADPH-dependent F420 reductase [Dehalococcoidia bacterium]